MKTYHELLISLLQMEYGKTPEKATALVRDHPGPVLQGIMAGNQSLRAVAMALDDYDAKAP